MNVRTLLLSAGLLFAACGAALAQPQSFEPMILPPAPAQPGLLRAESLRSIPAPPAEKSVDDLLTELERVQAEKAALEKKEQELKAALRKKLEQQTERLKKLGVAPQDSAGRSSAVRPAPYPLIFAKDNPKKDKEEIVVVVLARCIGASPTFFNTERELVAELGRMLPEMAKENKDRRTVRVISPAQIDKFKKDNPNWKTMSAGEFGEKLGADFVLDIELSGMRLYQPNTGFEKIFEGRAEVNVIITEVTATGSGEIRDYPLSFSYPKGLVRDGSAISESEFKKQYIKNLAAEIAARHVDTPKEKDPDRVGRIIIEGNTKTPEEKILDLLELKPGGILQYPKIEEARIQLQKAGFREVTIEVVQNDFDVTIKDLRIKVVESKSKEPKPKRVGMILVVGRVALSEVEEVCGLLDSLSGQVFNEPGTLAEVRKRLEKAGYRRFSIITSDDTDGATNIFVKFDEPKPKRLSATGR